VSVPTAPRIEALDVLRGFALIGICLMNIEFFNRPLLEAATGMQPDLTGIDWLAGFVVAYFVAGKFWTIFALLFGMGFGVMLDRAQAAGRPFLGPYLRRIAALAVFGILHQVLLWNGDILLSYAVAAVFLLVALYGTWKWMSAAFVLCAALALFPVVGATAGAAAAVIALTGLLAMFLRLQENAIASICAVLGDLVLVAAGATFFVSGPAQAAGPAAAGAALLLVAFLAKKYHDPASARPWRAGVALYALSFAIVAAVGAAGLLAPPAPVTTVTLQTPGSHEAAASAGKTAKERAVAIAEERKVLSSGTYGEAAALRTRHLLTHLPDQMGGALIAVAVFLLGTWFVSSGVALNIRAHLPLFRKFVVYGLPAGIGLGLLSSLVATSQLPGKESNFQLANGLLALGSLPASLGYVGLVILMLYSSSRLAKIAVLAPYGRMALTNYLMQSLVCTLVFYGYGLGYWGIGRAWQLVFALALCALQILFSHWWLARFRYGPAEWLWRAVTYLKSPAMRVAVEAERATAQI
jgi:uncharacterized membrane protein YeiB